MSDVSQGEGWWEASDERWYPPEDDLMVSPGWHQGELSEWLPPTGSEGGTPGWWVSANGDWYPPERHPTPNPRAEMPDEDDTSNGLRRSIASDGKWHPSEQVVQMHDFEDDNGPVPAHQHPNGGGWVADSAAVSASAFVGPDAAVFGLARVFDHSTVTDTAWVHGEAEVGGHSRVGGDALVDGNSRILGNADVTDRAHVSGSALVDGYARVGDNAQVLGHAVVKDDARLMGDAEVNDEEVLAGEAVINDPQEGTLTTNDEPHGPGWWIDSDAEPHPSDAASMSVPVAPIDPHVEESPAASSPSPHEEGCINGHGMDTTDRFCAVCGAPRGSVSQGSAAAGFEQAEQHPMSGGQVTYPPASRRKRFFRTRTRVIMTIVIGIVALVLVSIGAIAIFGSHGSSSSTSGSNATAASPGAVCYDNLLSWVRWGINNPNDQSLNFDFGMSNPIPNLVMTAESDFTAAGFQNGQSAAANKLAEDLVSDCTTLLSQGRDPTTWPSPPSS